SGVFGWFARSGLNASFTRDLSCFLTCRCVDENARSKILSLACMPIPPLSRVETTSVVLRRILHILAKRPAVATREIANAKPGESNVKSEFFLDAARRICGITPVDFTLVGV